MTKSESNRAITVKTTAELFIMWQANQIVAGVLDLLKKTVAPGKTTLDLDKVAEEYCRDHGAIPAFKGYRGFPASLCTSVNEEVVHGIPSHKTVLKEGDIISVDFGTLYKGFYGDSAVTIPCGRVRPEIENLLEVTHRSLMQGIEKMSIGNRVSDVSRAIQEYVEKRGYAVVKQFVGHGIGSDLHEAPEVPNYVQRGASPRLMEGMVLAIEPMVNIGTAKVKILKDNWTVVTADRKPSAHFEHSVAVTRSGPAILSKLGSSPPK
ncbi:MAG: type I methionyl aminopeptidase [Desulfobulbus propionicus]|nr:MAG: type I methionyl aminopeptidase [Desulfobulbus propionicus]